MHGRLIGGGTSGAVYLTPSGDIVKSPWEEDWAKDDCKRDISIEAQIYERLGEHPRLVGFKKWDPEAHILTLEYMPRGSVKEYIRECEEEISLAQRHQWAMQAAEAVEYLHTRKVIQADVGPHNLLLDSTLNLKICDFGGSSLEGSRAWVIPGVRYRIPGKYLGGTMQQATVKEDLLALGSTLYFIATGREPYEESNQTEDEVVKLYDDGIFPDLIGVPFDEAISMCWKQETESAEAVLEKLAEFVVSK